MTRRLLQLIPIGLLLLLVLLTYWLNQVVQPDDARRQSQERHDPDVIIDNFKAQKLSPTGDVEYTISAKKMRHFPDDKSSHLEHVELIATSADQPKVMARADEGEQRDVNQVDTVLLKGNVVIQSEAGKKMPALHIKTSQITMSPSQGIAKTNAGVVVESKLGIMHAKTFEMNSKSRHLRLTEVSGVLAKGTP